MKKELIREELEKVAERFAFRVIYDTFEGKGGRCRLRGENLLIINKLLPENEKIKLLSTELKKLPVDDIFIPPKIREIIQES